MCFINFSFGAKHVTPRSLSAHFIGNMVCVEGIVTKCKSHFVKFIFWNGVWNPSYTVLASRCCQISSVFLDRKYTPPMEGFLVEAPTPWKLIRRLLKPLFPFKFSLVTFLHNPHDN